ncbi:MAG: YggS family pyridoxal phosphate-dependent enzyme [Marinilabiliaceae bacterium]
MTSIQTAIQDIRLQLPEGVRLLAVSKTHPVAFIEEAYAIGQRDFGENKVQEMTAKAEALPKDIRWHLIGHLQTNKVKYIAPFVYMIHSIDSQKLIDTVEKEAAKAQRVVKCLLQVHVAKEETKFGFSPDELAAFLADGKYKDLPHVQICGLMAMATNTDDSAEVEREFEEARQLFIKAKEKYFPGDENFRELSMGMSGDYKLAIAHGSTCVRIGSRIFGLRDYSKQK